jgi:ribosomal protein L11 methyltransferase
LWELGTTGVAEGEGPGGRVELRAYFKEPFPPDEFARWGGRWGQEEQKNWARIVMESWEPIAVGERFFVAPDWRDDPTPEGRLRLIVHPGNAFGTGYHATTQLCMEAMERLLRPAEAVFDLGCGAGILTHAAMLLGAARLLCCDIDHEASVAALENFRDVCVPAVLFTGGAEAVRKGVVDLVVANISAETLMESAPMICRLLAPGGRAILSGFAPERLEEVVKAFTAEEMQRIDSAARDEWACVTLRHRGVAQ